LFAPVPLVNIEEVAMSELDSTERGEGGFGSSGQY
jgi:dUTPase